MRACFDGGVSKQEDRKVKHKVWSAYAIQASERIEEAAEKMEWRTKVEVAKVPPDDATISQAETTAAVEAARATCCLDQSGQNIYDLDGKLIDEWDKSAKRTKNKMKDNTEERRKRKLDDENYASATDMSHSTSVFLSGHLSIDLSKRDDKFEVLQIGCKAHMDGSACTDRAMSELW